MVADPWRVIADRLAAAYNTGSMVRGGEFVAKIIDAAEEANHHPDIDLPHPRAGRERGMWELGRVRQ